MSISKHPAPGPRVVNPRRVSLANLALALTIVVGSAAFIALAVLVIVIGVQALDGAR